MRKPFEFSLYTIAARDLAGGIDPTLALMGSQGWEIRGLTSTAAGDIAVALQRPLDEALPLPDGATLAATLEEPLTAPPAQRTQSSSPVEIATRDGTGIVPRPSMPYSSKAL